MCVGSRGDSCRIFVGHAAEICYASSNKAVAVVDANGTVTAKGKGECTVYAVAVDGKRTTVNVKVE
ncbi:MAG: Ig-like domain-containing protein [Lachnospiraceae bacterium]|nr:Ig-like domain-containing protein [Lachnospiraceae bacterium]